MPPKNGCVCSIFQDRGGAPECRVRRASNGKRPDGAAVSKVMPFMTLRNINDTDLNAMYAYLKSMPPKKAGEP